MFNIDGLPHRDQGLVSAEFKNIGLINMNETKVINIFKPILKKILVELRSEGPKTLSYIGTRYGAPALVELLESEMLSYEELVVDRSEEPTLISIKKRKVPH